MPGGEKVQAAHGFFELLEPSTAEVLARFDNVDGQTPAITVTSHGKGRALCAATTAQAPLMAPLGVELLEP